MKLQKNKIIKQAISFLKSISLIDYIGVGLFFAIVLLSAFFFLRRARYVTVVFRVSEVDTINLWSKPPLWYVESIQPGMSEKDGFGRETIKVNEVITSSSGVQNKVVFLDLSIRAVYNKRTNQYSYNGVPLLVGSYQTLKLQGVQITGIVHRIGKDLNEDQGDYVRVKGSVAGYLIEEDADFIESYSDGVSLFRSQVISEELLLKGSNEKILASIVQVDKVPSTRTFVSNGSFQKQTDRDKEKVDLVVDLYVKTIAGQKIFLEEQIVQVGKVIYLNFEEFDLPIIVEEILEVN